MTCRQAIKRDPLLDRLTPGQRAKLQRLEAAYAANDPGRELPPVVTGKVACEQDAANVSELPQGVVITGQGEYARSHTPHITGPARRRHEVIASMVSIAMVFFALGLVVAGALFSIFHK